MCWSAPDAGRSRIFMARSGVRETHAGFLYRRLPRSVAGESVRKRCVFALTGLMLYVQRSTHDA